MGLEVGSDLLVSIENVEDLVGKGACGQPDAGNAGCLSVSGTVGR